ncbi:hypothetical protein NPIL_497421 [Nephila pilipes]|uniref:Uncharacterized protein n=1 Tax=Nephila pilipes TaxID=299642 RepID=A0A8X6URP9_NEPPI|nr:hypothetical protein NPIL_497421 [Nephila pilipes]
MLEFREDLDWKRISQFQVLNDGFLIDHNQLLEMSLVSRYQHLSENTIELSSDVLDWDVLLKYKSISDSLLTHHIDKITQCDSLDLTQLHEGVINYVFKRMVLMYLKKICIC